VILEALALFITLFYTPEKGIITEHFETIKYIVSHSYCQECHMYTRVLLVMTHDCRFFSI